MGTSFTDYCRSRRKFVETMKAEDVYDGIMKVLTELYPDNAHFIYELLQNAEDKGARNVSFRLTENALIFEHDGPELFSLKNVKAITGIGNSTSRDEPTKIGKFGIGFKSVFAYTDSPEVHSGDFHFRILDLLVPEIDGVDLTPLGPLTRFVFPFNHHRKSKSVAIDEIQQGLLALPDTTLLFLKNIGSLEYEFYDGSNGYIRKTLINRHAANSTNESNLFEIQSRRPRAESRTNAKRNASGSSTACISQWLRFDRIVELIDTEDDDEQKQCRICVAYSLGPKESGAKEPSLPFTPISSATHRILPVTDGQVSIYFPAVSEKSNLRFHIHAPFASTVARANVRTCAVNSELRDHVASLVSESLKQLRFSGYLIAELLGVMPLPIDGLTEFYAPIRTRIVSAFQNSALVPTLCGKHRKAKRLRWGPPEITSRLRNRELAVLTNRRFLRWAAREVATPSSRQDQFVESLGIGEFGYDHLLAAARNDNLQLSKSWLEKKTTAWVCRLYRDLHKAPYQYGRTNARDAAVAYPLIRLSDDTHVSVKADIYLSIPDGVETDLQRVTAELLTDTVAKAFLRSIGILPFDNSAEARTLILPKYRKNPNDISFEEHLADLEKLDNAKWGLLADLKTVPLVKCVNAVMKLSKFIKGCEAYFDSPQLRTYCDGNVSAWFVSPEYQVEENKWLQDLFSTLGVARDRPREKNAVPYQKVKPRNHERGVDKFNHLWEIDGIQHALANPTVARAAFIWNELLADRMHLISGYIEKSTVATFPSNQSEREWSDSITGRLLKIKKWIPKQGGGFVSASEVGGLEQLHDALNRDAALLSLLDNRRTSSEREAAKALKIDDVPPLVVERIRTNESAKKLFLGHLQNATGGTERRASRVREQSDKTDPRTFALRERSTRVGRVSSDEVLNYLATYYRMDEMWHCQMCCYPMPYQKRNGDQCHERRELLTGKWAKKKGLILPIESSNSHPKSSDGVLPDYEKLFIVLCPLCSSFFHEYVACFDSAQDALFAWLQSGSGTTHTIACSSVNSSETDRAIHFHPKHVGDIRAIRVVGAHI